MIISKTGFIFFCFSPSLFPIHINYCLFCWKKWLKSLSWTTSSPLTVIFCVSRNDGSVLTMQTKISQENHILLKTLHLNWIVISLRNFINNMKTKFFKCLKYVTLVPENVRMCKKRDFFTVTAASTWTRGTFFCCR